MVTPFLDYQERGGLPALTFYRTADQAINHRDIFHRRMHLPGEV
jgi:hypothetical protein